MKGNTIIKNGRLMTMDEREHADWIVIEDDIIKAVGDGDGYKAYLAKGSKLIDAGQASVLPGFIDNHFHVVVTALSADWVSLEGVRNYSAMGRRIRAAKAANPGKLIIATRLDAGQLDEGDLPDRTVLDKFCKDTPVAIYSADYKVLILNTCGILYFKVPFTSAGVGIDEKGMPTGIFTGQAGARLDRNIFRTLPEADGCSAIQKLIPELFRYGLTTVAAVEGGNMTYSMGEEPQSELIYAHHDKYPLDMKLFYQTTDIQRVLDKDLKRIGGALYVDGTIGERTAALLADYSDAPGKKGIYCIQPECLKAFVTECYSHHLQVSLDAIGDGAIALCLEAFACAQKQFDGRYLRNRIEHAEMINAEQMEKARELGIILSMQPTYEGIWGGEGKLYHQRLGNRYKETNPFREILDYGIVLCGGSDSNVTDPNPMMGIHYAVNHPVEAHRITVEEAVRMYTYNGAYALFEEEQIGSLTPGKKADIVVMNKNLKKIQPNQLKKVKVDLTMKNGRIVFNRGLYAET